jgi:hypothetical protein
VLILALLPILRAGGYPDFRPLTAKEYPSYQEQRGIGLAVVPLLDKTSQKRYFGENLQSQGFLPVYIVIENHADLHSAFVLRDRIVYQCDDSAPLSRAQQQRRPGASGVLTSMAQTATTLNYPLIAGILLPSINSQRMNLLAKELRSQTVSPGKSGSGFVFVPVRKSASKVFLDVPVKDGQSDQDIHFHFQIEMRSGKR